MTEQKETPKTVKPANGFTFLEVTAICLVVFTSGVLMGNSILEIIYSWLTEFLNKGI